MEKFFQKDLINLLLSSLIIVLGSYLITFSISYLFINNLFEITFDEYNRNSFKIIGVLTAWYIIIHLFIANFFREYSSNQVEFRWFILLIFWIMLYCSHLYICLSIIGASIN